MTASGNSNNNRFTAVLIGVAALLIVGGWANVYRQSVALQRAVVRSFQEATLEIVRSASTAAQVYAEKQIEQGRGDEIPRIEEEIFHDIIDPIELLVAEGDAWIIGRADTMVFDQSIDFVYEGIPIDEFLELQAAAAGANSYEQMRDDVLARQEGTGQYVWESDKGPEVGAWTPVNVTDETTWMIGLTTPLSAIMHASGADDTIRRSAITMGIVTAVVILVLVGFQRSQRQVNRLQTEVHQLRIEIDKAKSDKVIEEVTQRDFFKELEQSAAAMRRRRKQRRQE